MENYKIKCDIFDFRRHIAFDTSQMELPAKCDLCSKHATHFCMVHRGVYCAVHISHHDGITVDRFDTSQDSAELVKKFGVLEDGIPVFSEEDIDLVVQRTGVDREKARHALVEAKGDLARTILILMTG